MAYEGEFLGKPSVTVFLFSQKIDKEKASQVALSSFPSQDKWKIAVGTTPILQLIFFYEKGSNICDLNNVISLTTVFEKSEDFAFPIDYTKPISWAAASKDLAQAQLKHLNCYESFIKFSISGNRLASKQERALLGETSTEVKFSWNIALEVALLTKVALMNLRKYISGHEELSSYEVKDSIALWIKKHNLLMIRLFGKPLSSEEQLQASSRGGLPSVLTTTIMIYLKPTTSSELSKSLIEQYIISHDRLTGPKSVSSDSLTGKSPSDFLSLGCILKVGQTIELSVKEESEGKPDFEQPAYKWDYQISSLLQAEYDDFL